MTPTLRQRCFRHGERIAVARCGGCGRPFCRECVTEHDGRMVCGACLPRHAARAEKSRWRWFVALATAVRTAAAFFVVWLFFHWVGLALLEIPSALHEGTVWDKTWWEEEAP